MKSNLQSSGASASRRRNTASRDDAARKPRRALWSRARADPGAPPNGQPREAIESRGKGNKKTDSRRRSQVTAYDSLATQNENLREARREIEEALHRYADLYDYAPVGYATLGTAGRIEQINLAGAALLGRSRKQILIWPFSTFLAGRKDRAVFNSHIQRCRASQNRDDVITSELDLRSHGQPAKTVQLTTHPAHQPLPGQILLSITDITNLRQIKDAAQKSEMRFRMMAELVPAFIFTTTPTGEPEYINQRFTDFTGLTAEQSAGFGWLAAVHPDDRERTLENSRRCLEEGKLFQQEFRLRMPDGKSRWFRSAAQPVRDAQGVIEKWFGACADIDDIMRARSELSAANESLEQRVIERTAKLAAANQELDRQYKERQRLENEILVISERERRTLGNALHDGVCQHLSGVAMMAHILGESLAQRSLTADANKVRMLSDLVHTASDQAREVARGLQPVDVDASGLVSALSILAARHDVRGGIRCRCVCPRPVAIRKNDVAMHLYRIAQESVVNAITHARARNIIIDLRVEKKTIVLSISDDGVGLPPERERPSGLGLRLMRSRADVIGAAFVIESPQDGGTVVKCTLPVPLRSSPQLPVASH